MDTLQFHYGSSIFPQNWGNQGDEDYIKYRFWNPSVSWLNKYIDRTYTKGLIKWWVFDKPSCLTDGWHLFKTIMIFALCGSIMTFNYTIFDNWIESLLLYGMYGFIWNFTFMIFYKHILIKRVKK